MDDMITEIIHNDNAATALIKGELVSSFVVTVPPLGPQKLQKILPNLMADKIAGEVADHHVVMLEKQADDQALVAVIRATDMSELIVQEGNFKAAFPDYLALPRPEESSEKNPEDNYTYYLDGDRVLIRHVDGTGVVLARSIWHQLYNPSLGYQVFGLDHRALPMGADLLVGAFSPQKPWQNYGRYFKRSAVLVLMLLFSYSTYLVIKTQQNQDYAYELQDAQISLFKEAFPEVRRVVNVEVQLNSMATGKGGAANGDALSTIARGYEMLSKHPLLSLQSLRYQDGAGATPLSLLLSVSSPDFASLETFKTDLSNQSFIVSDGGARQEDERIFSDITLKLEGAE